ncbi:MAG: hypothetical protein HYX94_10095 [Chloroflexi bacterium]|nr:hypothetical protein [Chloroflexota bacterium]
MNLRRATIKAFDAASHSATIQLDGSLSQYIAAIEVAANILAADVTAGRYAVVAWPEDSNPAAAVIIAVYA